MSGNVIRDVIDKASAEKLSAELLRIMRGMAADKGRAVTLAAIEHAVGTFCDDISPRHAAIMGAAILGVDPEQFVREFDRVSARRNKVLS